MEENIKKTKIVTLIITGTIFLGFLIYLIYHYFLFGKSLFNEIGQEISFMIFFFIILPFFLSLIDYIIYKFRIFK
jgi:hypothetical protein